MTAQMARLSPVAMDRQKLEERRQYLTFMLSGETYAIGILRIKEISQYGQLTEVPRMPDFALVPIYAPEDTRRDLPVDVKAALASKSVSCGRSNSKYLGLAVSDVGWRGRA